MKASAFYRIAAVLMVLFDAGHTAGYPWSDPKWGVDLGPMRSTHFDVLGFSRTYWDFYVGFGLFGTVLLLFAALLVWQLGSLPADTLASMRFIAWALPFCFAAMSVLSWRYFFIIPVLFSIAITVCLLGAAWRSMKPIPDH
jgi:hypothetical protein